MNAVSRISLLTIGLAALACNKVEFRPVDQTALSSEGTFGRICRTENVEKARPVHVLFLVDQSGSNVNGPYEHPGRGADPDKSLRLAIMSDFIVQHGGKANVRWSLMTFNDAGARGLVRSAEGAPAFTDSLHSLGVALNDFADTADVGSTPYKAALTLAEQTIRADSSVGDPNSLYLIAFMTDGYPTDYCPGGILQQRCPGRILDGEIDEDVRRLVSAAAGTVQLGTVYYGVPDIDASARLSRMAQQGGGQFVDLNTMAQIDLNDVIQVPQEVCE